MSLESVCAFLAANAPDDESLRAFELVYPAAGSRTASVCLSPKRMAEMVEGRWADLCKIPPG